MSTNALSQIASPPHVDRVAIEIEDIDRGLCRQGSACDSHRLVRDQVREELRRSSNVKLEVGVHAISTR